MKRLAIVGAGGHGMVTADAAACAGWEAIAFFDDAPDRDRPRGPWAVAGPISALLSGGAGVDGVVIGVGDNAVRLRLHARVAASGLTLVTVVHPSAVISAHAVLEPGTVVFANAVVNPFARLGRSCIVNTSASVDHDCVLGDGVHVGPGAHLGGDVRVGEATWIGIGASVRHGISIGARVMIGGGAMVVTDVEDGVKAVGVPARDTAC